MNTSHSLRGSFWKRSHHLDKMSFRELVVAYFQYPAIIAYLLLAGVCAALWFRYPAPPLETGAAIAAAVMIYPLAWYVIHRWILHSRWMFKVPMLAATWKRIHYDHHQDPNHLEVLFGALHTTLPTIVLATAPAGWLIGGTGGAFAAVSRVAHHRLLRVLPLHPASGLQAPQQISDRDEGAPHGASLP